MKKYFICLANSKKYGERCVAGIEVTQNNAGNFSIVKNGSKPKWIRPVTDNTHGAVSEEIAGKINLLEVYEIEITEESPNGYQSENVKFKLDSLKHISTIGAKSTNLDVLSETSRSTIFTNRGKAIPKDKIENLDHSLVLIKSIDPELHINNEYGKNQLRIKFQYNSNTYDLPITDKAFISKYNSNNNIISESNEVYISVSVGVEYEEWFYKLAAGIICI